MSIWFIKVKSLIVYILSYQYSDNYYRAALVDALAMTVTPAVNTVTITGSVYMFSHNVQ